MDEGVWEFLGNDREYLGWLETHPDGFVVNTPRGFPPTEMVLHRATCSCVSSRRAGTKPGAFTERVYVKVCSTDLEGLREWVRAHGRPDGTFTSTACPCSPGGSTVPRSSAPAVRPVGERLPEPNAKHVRRRLEALKSDAYFYGFDGTVALVFQQWPDNADFAQVHAKVTILNALYSAGVRTIDTDPVASHILELDTDRRLEAGDLTLVRDMARTPIGDGKIRVYYSFATKYCSWHRPDAYQIYDSYVDWLLWEYRKQFAFQQFQRQQLGVYPDFVRIVDGFRGTFGLEEFSRKDIDKFLWAEGKRRRPW